MNMTIKNTALSAVLVAGLLSLSVFAVMVIVQNGPSATAPTVLAQSEPEPLTEGEFEEFVQDVCNHSGVLLEEFNQSGRNDGDLYIEWAVDEYRGPHTGPRFDGWKRTYRLERNKVWESQDWETVEDIKNRRFWKGRTEDGGEWSYRVRVLAVSLGDRTMNCVEPHVSNEAYFHIVQPLTTEETAELRQRICSEFEITYIEGAAEWDVASLHWETNVTSDEWFGVDSENYLDWGLRYRVERQVDGEDTWTIVGTEVVDIELWPLFGGAWEGDAEPGRSSYRVALAGITVAEQVHPCQGELRWSDVVTVETPTLTERAEREAERDILVAEALRCAKDAFTRNVSEEAAPIVQRYVEELVLGDAGQGHDPARLVGLTVTMCSFMDGNDGGSGWETLMLFDLFSGGSW